jgi:predicted enzyme related to lactoylglutathione lyase
MYPARRIAGNPAQDVISAIRADRVVSHASTEIDALARLAGVATAPRSRLADMLIEPKSTPLDVFSDVLAVAPKSVSADPGVFSWHEFTSTEPLRSGAFLADLVGGETHVRTRDGLEEYTTILNAGLHVAGGLRVSDARHARWKSYLRVPSVDLLCDIALAHGGRVTSAPSGILGLDRRATIADPTGAELTVIAGGDDRRTIGCGAFGWDELRSSDPLESVRFWCATLDWTATPIYTRTNDARTIVFQNGGRPVASVSQTLAGEPRSRWLPVATFRHGLCNAMALRAIRAGASMRVAPHAHGILGTHAVLIDPTGLELAIGDEVANACELAA